MAGPFVSGEESTQQVIPDQEGEFLNRNLELVHRSPEAERRYPLHRTILRLELGPGHPHLQLRWMDGLLIFVNLRPEVSLVYRRRACASGELEVGESLRWGDHELALVDRSAQNRATLECYSDPFYARIWPLDQESVPIGRPGQRANRVNLNHPTISRQHATLLWQNQQAYLRSDSATAVTLVNGQRLEAQQSCTLPDGALVQLGSLLFQFRLLAQTPPQRRPLQQLQIASLGGFEVRIGSYTIEEREWRTQSARWLLARLALEWGRPLAVEVLCADFWPDKSEDSARNNLNFCLSSLRQLLRPHTHLPEPFLRATGTLQLHPDWLGSHDAWQLRQWLRESEVLNGEPQQALWQKILDLYTGPYLPGCQAEWALSLRSQLEQQVLHVGRQLLNLLLDREDWALVVPLAQKLLTLECCCPTAHRALLLAAQQQRCLADLVRHYKFYERVMLEQMDLPPDDSVARVYERALQELS